MKKNMIVDEFGFVDEVWGGDDHLTDGPAATDKKPAADATKGNDKPGSDGKSADDKKPETMVPVSAVEAERKKRQTSESENNFLKGQIAAMQSQPAKVEKKVETKLFEGKDKEDLVSVGSVTNALDKMQENFSNQMSNLKTQNTATAALMNSRSNHTDFDQVAQFYLDAAATDPEMKKLVENSPIENRAALVYRLGKTTDAYAEHKQKSRTQDIKDRINVNDGKPGVSGSAGPTKSDGQPIANSNKSVLDGQNIQELNNEIASVIANGFSG